VLSRGVPASDMRRDARQDHRRAPRGRVGRRRVRRSCCCIVSGSSFATSFEYGDDPGLHELSLLAILATVCGSCGAPAAHANALARRAFPSSSLRCRQPPVGGSGAGLSVSLFPLSQSLVCRSIGICHEQLRDAPAAAERAAYRAKRIAQVRSRAHARDRVPREGAAVRACCARCAWRVAAILGAIVAWEARRVRWCAARRARRPCWRHGVFRCRPRVGYGQCRVTSGAEILRDTGRYVHRTRVYYGLDSSSMMLGCVWHRKPRVKSFSWSRTFTSQQIRAVSPNV
jgi:hypothetical protein